MATNLTGYFINKYGPFINPLPDPDTLAAEIDFVPETERPGNTFNFPIVISRPMGVTFDNTNTAFALNPAREMITKQATLSGSTILPLENISYDDIAAALNPQGVTPGGMSTLDLKVKMLLGAGMLWRELVTAYGSGSTSTLAANIGVVNASISGANLAAPQVVNITRGTWMAGLWNSMNNALVDVYQTDGQTLRDSGVTVQAVVAATNRVQLYKAASTATVAANDVIVPAGALGKQCYGLESILSNTGSLFGIDAALYPMWKAVSFSAASATLTRVKIKQFGARLSLNGVKDGGTLFTHPMTFADLVEEFDALRQYIDDQDTRMIGASRIQYKTACGMISVLNYPYAKPAQAFFLEKGCCKRVGTTDLTFKLPNAGRPYLQSELPSNAGSQIRLYTNQAPVCTVPYHCGIITAIVNNGDTTPA